MPLITRAITSLVGGVSQQAAFLRRSSQCELAENCLLSVVKGSQKRPPTEYQAKLQDGTVGDQIVHTINRDPNERYKVVISNGDLHVFDIDGVEKTVAFPDGKTYLNAASPSSAFRSITIADYTFITNNTVQTAMLSDTVPVSRYQGLFFLKAIAPQSWYRIIVDGVQYQSLSDSDHPNAGETMAGLRGLIPSGTYHTNLDRSTIYLYRDDGADFEIKADDPSGAGGFFAFKNTVQNFTDLPTIATRDYYVKILGATGNPNDIYYVKFVPNNATQSMDVGVWQETVAEGVQYKIDAATMPHVLVRESDGTFTFKKATWDDRNVGDDNTNTTPSFIGNTINDVVFHKGRLGFLSDSNVILSQSGKFFNFWRTTVTTLLDTDPIDVSANQVAILRYAIDFNGNLLLFSDKPQFVLAGGDLLTPKSAVIKQVTQFESIGTAAPTSDGKNVYFAVPKSNYSGLMEFYIDPVSGQENANDVSAHVPKYVKGKITKLAASTTDDLVLTLSDNDKSVLYPYKYFWAGDTKAQSAWSTWTFNGGQIIDMDFLNSVIYFIIQRNDGVYLEKMDISVGRTDSDDVDHLTILDRRVDETQCSSVSYNAGTDRTTWTLPYTPNPSATYSVVTRYESDGNVAGVTPTDVEVSSNTVSVSGDYHDTPVYIGETFTQRQQLSQFFWSDPKSPDVTIADARVQLLFSTLAFEKTGYCKIIVQSEHRPDAQDVYEFEGKIMDAGNNITDTIVLSDGKLRFRVGSDAAHCTVTIENSTHLPCNLQTASWEGRVSLRTPQA